MMTFLLILALSLHSHVQLPRNANGPSSGGGGSRSLIDGGDRHLGPGCGPAIDNSWWWCSWLTCSVSESGSLAVTCGTTVIIACWASISKC
jgi:hypothetical protein